MKWIFKFLNFEGKACVFITYVFEFLGQYGHFDPERGEPIALFDIGEDGTSNNQNDSEDVRKIAHRITFPESVAVFTKFSNWER